MRPFYLLPKNNNPALSDKYRILTYEQLIAEVLACKKILNASGYTKDHRIAMSIAPLSMKVNSIKLDDKYVVNKSYPKFWKDLKKAGLNFN